MKANDRGLLNASRIAIATAVLPACLFPVTYLLAASQGHVDWCLPFLQGCTDITHTGLKSPESHLFRFGLMSASALLGVVWYLVWVWIRRVDPQAGAKEKSISNTGIWAAILLALGTATLQHKDTQWTLHVIGASGFFLFVYIAQVRLTRYLWQRQLAGKPLISERSMRAKRLIVRFETLLYVGVIIAKLFGFKEMTRAIEWTGVYALLYFIFTLARDWQGRYELSVQFQETKLDPPAMPPKQTPPKPASSKSKARDVAETPLP